MSSSSVPTMQPENKKLEFTGFFRAVIENISDTKDPKKYARVQVRVYGKHSEVMPIEALPWATIAMPFGTRFNEGGLPPMRKGDMVWVFFDCCDPAHPVIFAAQHFCPEGKPNLPHEIWEGDEQIEYQRVKDEPRPAKHDYFANGVFTYQGVTVEIREGGVWGITQREKGTSFYVDADANWLIHGEKSCWISAKNNSRVIIGENAVTEIGKDSKLTIAQTSQIEIGGESSVKVGKSQVTDIASNDSRKVGGNETVRISGNKDVSVSGNYMITASGNYQSTVSGNFQNTVSGSMSVNVSGNISQQSGGSFLIQSGGSVSIQSGGLMRVQAPMIFLN